MELIATKSLRYAGKSLVAGDKFEASAKDARLLKAVGKAGNYVAPAVTHEDAGTAHDPDASGHEQQGRKSKYRTRRMKADDDNPEVAYGEDG